MEHLAGRRRPWRLTSKSAPALAFRWRASPGPSFCGVSLYRTENRTGALHFGIYARLQSGLLDDLVGAGEDRGRDG